MNELIREHTALAQRVKNLDAQSGLTYQYGTWVPAFTGTTIAGTFTYTATRYGYWTLIGNTVHLAGRVQISAITVAPTGSMSITGVPFAPTAVAWAGTIAFSQNFPVPASGDPGLYIILSSTSLNLYYRVTASGNSANYPAASFTLANADVVFNLTYRIL